MSKLHDGKANLDIIGATASIERCDEQVDVGANDRQDGRTGRVGVGRRCQHASHEPSAETADTIRRRQTEHQTHEALPVRQVPRVHQVVPAVARHVRNQTTGRSLLHL
jgi:hypothetical protein